ncbi:MAG: T9SS type A sorting domain-containing protein [Fibromonadales bacterium]|nr:T9SS type A sorting domain-containing protein [Fibromonadales bacterium]
MKKILVLPLLAVAMLVGQAWAAIDCNIGVDGVIGCCWYNETDCYGYGGIYNDAQTAEECSAGYGRPQPNCDAPFVEYCRWETSCWAIQPGDRDGCVADGSVYRDVPPTGVGAGKQCEGGTWTGEGKDPNRVSRGFCDWGTCVPNPENQYACLEGGCFEIENDAQEADCNNKLTSKAQCPIASLPPAEQGSPVISGSTIASLNVLVQTSSLHISSAREATMQLFDVSGKQVFSQKVPSGYSVVNLKDQKMGVYFAVVTSGSHKQTVKVTLK